MATNTITARLDLSGQGTSSDSLEQSQTMTFNVTDPTVQSGALDVGKVAQTLANIDGTQTANTFLYIKNTGSAIMGELNIATERSSNAVGFFAFVANPTNGQTVTLLSTDNTTKTYTAHSSEDTATNKFISTGTMTEVATSLANCIQAATGHAGKIIVTQDAGALTLTQSVGGAAGNKTITTTVGAAAQAHADFTGGVDNAAKVLAELKPGQWTTLPVKAACDMSIYSGSSTTCEYGYWTMVV